MLACPIEAAVRDLGQMPYCVSSPDEAVNRVLIEEWDHNLVVEGSEPGKCKVDRHVVSGTLIRSRDDLAR